MTLIHHLLHLYYAHPRHNFWIAWAKCSLAPHHRLDWYQDYVVHMIRSHPHFMLRILEKG